MTTYFKLASSDSGQLISWDNSGTWAQDSVPNGSSDGVILQALSGPAGIYLNAGVTQSIASLQIQANMLFLSGSLSVASNVNIGGTGTIDIAGGSLSAGHIVVNGAGITGVGSVTASNSLEVYSKVTASSEVGGAGISPGTLTISGATFYNSGTLVAADEGTLLVETTQANGFLNFSNGTLTGGTYQLDSGGTLELHTNGVISTDAANLVIDGNYPAMMSSYNPNNGQFANIETTLDLIATSGTLTVNNANFALEFGLTVDGKVQLNQGTLGASTVSVAQGGVIAYNGSSANPAINVDRDFITDNGEIVANATAAASTSMVFQSHVQGSGSIVVGAAMSGHAVTVDLEQAVSVSSIAFSDNSGTVILGTPSQVSSTFHGFAGGDGIILKGISLSSVTSYAYSNGVLAIHEGSTEIDLHFAGSYATDNFSLVASAQSTEVHLVGVSA